MFSYRAALEAALDAQDPQQIQTALGQLPRHHIAQAPHYHGPNHPQQAAEHHGAQQQHQQEAGHFSELSPDDRSLHRTLIHSVNREDRVTFHLAMDQLTGPADDPGHVHLKLQELLFRCAHDDHPVLAARVLRRIAEINYSREAKCTGVLLALRDSDEKRHVQMVEAILGNIHDSAYGEIMSYSDLRYALVRSAKLRDYGVMNLLLNQYEMRNASDEEQYEVLMQMVLCSSQEVQNVFAALFVRLDRLDISPEQRAEFFFQAFKRRFETDPSVRDLWLESRFIYAVIAIAGPAGRAVFNGYNDIPAMLADLQSNHLGHDHYLQALVASSYNGHHHHVQDLINEFLHHERDAEKRQDGLRKALIAFCEDGHCHAAETVLRSYIGLFPDANHRLQTTEQALEGSRPHPDVHHLIDTLHRKPNWRRDW